MCGYSLGPFPLFFWMYFHSALSSFTQPSCTNWCTNRTKAPPSLQSAPDKIFTQPLSIQQALIHSPHIIHLASLRFFHQLLPLSWFFQHFLVSQQPPNFYSAPCKECLLTWSSNNCIYHNSHNHNHHNPHNQNQNHNHNHHNSPHHRNDFLCAGSLNGVRDGDWLRQNI